MEDIYYYNTWVKWDESRVDTLSLPTLDSFKVTTPPEFPKGVPNTWLPGHIYFASVYICLISKSVKKKLKTK
ncbi:MAG: hypothetical protein O6940_12305, partial [Ignavibacteria bacterium]|nr:hypothetical protein [Ignavibacteria bacterium]